MNTNTTNWRDNLLHDQYETASIPELKVLRPDGSWKPVAACMATPQQFDRALSAETVERFIALARQSNLDMDGVIDTIRENWNH